VGGHGEAGGLWRDARRSWSSGVFLGSPSSARCPAARVRRGIRMQRSRWPRASPREGPRPLTGRRRGIAVDPRRRERRTGLVVEAKISQPESKSPDFSVVVFRLHFMLVSEEHLMKPHKNQWLLNLLSPLISLGEPRTRVHTMVSVVQAPTQGRDRGRFPRDMGLQTLENTVFSRGIIGKSAPILAEITIRKSQVCTKRAFFHCDKLRDIERSSMHG
jgi:hypothetical protein